MQSASWFAPPEAVTPNAHSRETRSPRQNLPPPSFEDEAIEAALGTIEAGEVLSSSRPPRVTRRAKRPVEAPLWTKAPPPPALPSTPVASRSSDPEALRSTDPGVPHFEAEDVETPLSQEEVRAASTDEIPSAFCLPSRLKQDAPSRYAPPLAPPSSDGVALDSRFLDIEHSEPPASPEDLECAWFSDLALSPATEERDETPAQPAWAGDREASLADTLIRPASELEGGSLAQAPQPPAACSLEGGDAEGIASSFEKRVETFRVSSPVISVFRRSAVLEASPVPEAATAPESADREARRERESQHVVRARVAGVGARALAWIVDGAMIGTAVVLFVLAAARVAGFEGNLMAAVRDPSIAAALLALATIIGAVYVTAGALMGGQTFGARLAKIRVLDRRGRPPGISRALLRGSSAALGTVCFLIGLVWVVVDDHGQALHDKIARTYVVRV